MIAFLGEKERACFRLSGSRPRYTAVELLFAGNASSVFPKFAKLCLMDHFPEFNFTDGLLIVVIKVDSHYAAQCALAHIDFKMPIPIIFQNRSSFSKI